MDNKLLQQLYKMYQKEIYLYLFSLCRNKSIAEDLTQETFLKALLSLRSDHTNIRAWLYRVAKNLYLNYREKEKSRVSLEDIKEDLIDEQAEKSLNRLLVDERQRILYSALHKLPCLKREILTLQFFCGMTQKQIASLLNISPENVRVLAHRSKKELKIYLEENGYEIF